MVPPADFEGFPGLLSIPLYTLLRPLESPASQVPFLQNIRLGLRRQQGTKKKPSRHKRAFSSGGRGPDRASRYLIKLEDCEDSPLIATPDGTYGSMDRTTDTLRPGRDRSPPPPILLAHPWPR